MPQIANIAVSILFDGLAYAMFLFITSVGLSVTMGLMGFVNLAHGAFAMAGAPALVRYTGGTPVAARAFTEAMYTITVRENRRFTIPALDFRGTPTGIDARSVVLTGTTPVANLGIAHRQPGLGQIGAGYVRAPLACFEAAVEALFAAIDDGEGEGQNEPAPTPMPVE